MASILNTQKTDLETAFCREFGGELEGWVPVHDVQNPNQEIERLQSVKGGKWKGEAGVNMVEAITLPMSSISEMFQVLYGLEETDEDIIYTPFRPRQFEQNRSRWMSDPRYDSLREALDIEKPGHQECVNAMTNNASSQLNASGSKISPLGDDGVFIINLFNNLAPWLAHQAHSDMGTGQGHLAIWNNFALPARLPEWSRWFSTSKGMIKYIEALTPLFRVVNDEYVVYPRDQYQSIKNPTDLSFQWWFVRVKVSPTGVLYLEFRYLPSMPIHMLEHHVLRMVDVIEIALFWFHTINKGKPVRSPEEAEPAYRFLYDNMRSMPKYPLERDEWQVLVNDL